MLGKTALAFEPWLSTTETGTLVQIMARSDWKKHKRTGANLVSELNIQINRGVLSQNTSVVAAAFSKLWSNIYVAPTGYSNHSIGCNREGCLTDGIQADCSYHQHGPQLLAGTYGSYAVMSTVEGQWLSNGTRWAIDAVRLSLLVDALLDGMRWFTVHQYYWQWSVIGRTMDGRGSALRPSLGTHLATLPSKRSDELGAFAQGLAGASETPLRGHRAFWCSDYVVQSSASPRPNNTGWVMTMLMHSNRTTPAACVNGQGAMNEHIGDGMTYL